MNKAKINYIVDFILFIAFMLVSISGLVMFFILPSGSGGESFLITRHLWKDMHNFSGLLMVFLSIIHILLHIKWIICMTKGMFRKDKDCKT